MFIRGRIESIKQAQNRMIKKNPYLFLDDEPFFDAVFLDFDGVIRLNSKFNDACIQNVLRFCNETGAQIVISSSWQFDLRYDEMISHLNSKGLGPYIKSKTAGMSLPREERILNYLDNNLYVDRFVVLDDDRSFSVLSGYLIQTRPEEGFNEEKRQKAIKTFMKQAVLPIRKLNR